MPTGMLIMSRSVPATSTEAELDQILQVAQEVLYEEHQSDDAETQQGNQGKPTPSSVFGRQDAPHPVQDRSYNLVNRRYDQDADQ